MPANVDAVLKGRLRIKIDATTLALGAPVSGCWRDQGNRVLPAVRNKYEFGAPDHSLTEKVRMVRREVYLIPPKLDAIDEREHRGGSFMDSDKTTNQAHEKLVKSAGTIEASAFQQVDSADRRTELAADRTVLAAERTYAAWVRTGLAALASGIGARALLKDIIFPWLTSATATILILFSAFCFVAAVWRETGVGSPPPRPNIRRLPAPLLFGVNGFLMLVSIAALFGIWTSN